MEYDEEKVEVSAGPSSRPATAEEVAEEKRLVRKLDYRIMPIACLLYLFACKSSHVCFSPSYSQLVGPDLDRTNLGNARLQGLPQDILHGDPTGVLFDWINSIFFFSYVGHRTCARYQRLTLSVRFCAKFLRPFFRNYTLLGYGWLVLRLVGVFLRL